MYEQRFFLAGAALGYSRGGICANCGEHGDPAKKKTDSQRCVEKTYPEEHSDRTDGGAMFYVANQSIVECPEDELVEPVTGVSTHPRQHPGPTRPIHTQLWKPESCVPKPSVLFVSYTTCRGGSEVAMYRMASWLARHGYRIGIATPGNEWLTEKCTDKPITLLNVRIPKLDAFRNPLTDYFIYLARLVRATRQVARVIEQGNWDIVHVNALPNLAGAFAAKITGRPLLWHIHEITFQCEFAYSVLKWLPNLLADSIVCPSHAVQRRFSTRKSHVLRNAIPDRWADEDADPHIDVRGKYGIANDQRILLWIGGMEPRKGFAKLIEAFEQNHWEHPDFVLLVVCSITEKYEKLYQRMKVRAARLSQRVIFLENVTNPDPYYLAADLVIQTSILPESFGLTVLEAMAFGKPVVCSCNGGTVEFVEPGETAHGLRNIDANTLHAAITELLTNTPYRNRLARAGKEKARDFVTSKIAPQLEKLYRRIYVPA